ncbi:MAG: RNase P subunit p30 family protein [Candidatus Bathyarchaeota archaeon]|nr:RNase P subunit p30 family protein [Candidatus Bathyarchaeota archaeon]
MQRNWDALMTRFADLHLRVPIDDPVQTQNMITAASELGYSLVGIPLPGNVSQRQLSDIKQFCQNAKLDFVSRINLAPKNSNDLLANLRRYRRKFEIIAVRCNTKDVARQAAKDRRVDLIQFSVTNVRQRFFDHSEAELASSALCALEIEASPLLQLTSISRIRLLSSLRKEAATAQRAKVPIVVSSGATNSLLLRGPYDFAALCTLFELKQDAALKALSANPFMLIDRNKEKLSPGYVAPGIRVVGRKHVD